MKTLVGWIKEGEEHQKAFENSSAMKMGRVYLQGGWKTIRKTRFVRMIRRMIEEGSIVNGMNEVYEEGCRILSQVEEKKKREKMEEEKRKMEEAEKRLEEANKRMEEEKRKVEEEMKQMKEEDE